MIKEFLVSRLGERSTWSAILLVAAAWGLHFSPEQQYALTALGVVLAAPDKNYFKK